MAYAIISGVLERVSAIIEDQIRSEVILVRGAEKEVRRFSDTLNIIRNVLDDAERRRFKHESVKYWLQKLEDTSYEMEDVLDEWSYGILKLQIEDYQSNDADVASPKQKVCSFVPSSCLCFKKAEVSVRDDIGKKIETVTEQLDQIMMEKERYNFVMSQATELLPERLRVQSTFLVDLDEVFGRDRDREILVSELMDYGDSQGDFGPQVLSIVGFGGVGKTTLAQVIYSDIRVKEWFELRIWICVSDPFDEVGVAKGIIESVRRKSREDTDQLSMLFEHVIKSISGKRFLLVLDDVWTEDYKKWEPLKNSLKYGAAGSKILVTTRNQRVAEMIGTTKNDIYQLGQLSNEDCWSLLRHFARLNKEEFEIFQDIGKEIANKCGGLPIVAKVLGSLLRSKNSLEKWENILNSEIWEMDRVKIEVLPHFLLSYYELSPVLKHCFTYCAIFPKDSRIKVDNLIGNWMALGYLSPNLGIVGDMELKGREYIDILAMRSLFQDFEKDDLNEQIESFKMVDIVHDFAQFLIKDMRAEAAGMRKTTCKDCNPSLVSNVKEYRSLFCDSGEVPPNLCDCLTSLRVLGMRRCELRSIPRGMENLIHLRWLDLSYNELSRKDIKTICKLYHLQTLLLCSCNLREIPLEVGNLTQLRHLDLSINRHLKELPESICGLQELRTLNVDRCEQLVGLPEGIRRLLKLKAPPQ